jgi:amino acid adenylation domain-containing protein
MSDPPKPVPPLSPEKRALFALLLAQEGITTVASETIMRRQDTGSLPLSFAQQRLWFIDQLLPNNPAYNIPAVVRIEGVLNRKALQQGLSEVVRRHEALRTTFAVVEGQPIQVIALPEPFPLPLLDLQSQPETERAAEVDRLATEEAQRPFDLTRGPLIRASLLRLAEKTHVLLLTMHHIVSDGWSIGVAVRELAALYLAFASGQPAALPELPIQYADFALWQRQRMQGEILERQLVYWKQQLAGAPPMLELPASRPRPARQTFRGARQPFVLPMRLYEELLALSQREAVTLFMTLLAAFQTLLHRYTGEDDILVGSPIANRTRPEIEGLIGFFVNTLVLRTDLSGDPPFRELLARVREVTLGAYAHQDLPFEKLVEELQPERSLDHTPLFQVMFVLQNAPWPAIDMPALTLRIEDGETATAIFDLTLSIRETGQGLLGSFEFSTDLFDPDTIERMLEHFQSLLEGIVADSEQRLSALPLLTDRERRQLLVEWSGALADVPKDLCIHQLFEAQVARTPDAVAVISENQRLTYAALDQRANQLAQHLQTLGVGPEVRVGICMERSPELVVGVVGILKAGGAYVPLDPAYPHERLAFMLADAQITLLLTDRRLAAQLPDHVATVVCVDADWGIMNQEHVTQPTGGPAPDNLAYVIYTSGSTGGAKGVMISHRALVNHSLAVTQRYALQPTDRILQFASIGFDVAAEEIFPSWLSGATVVLRPSHISLSPADFLRFVEHEHLTVVNLPSSYWHEWVADLTSSALRLPRALRLVIVGSEQTLPERLTTWQRLAGTRVDWRNAYGPTEATITTTVYEPARTGVTLALSAVPIGRPIANAQVYLLDAQLQPVPSGVPGEIYIGGAGLARGYLNRPARTAERFIPHPFSDEPGARLYKTGDLARWLPDGNIAFLGRVDEQVKIRGFRIEPGEIEALLRQHSNVAESVVVARDAAPGDKRLVAYVVADQAPALTTSALRSFLAERLPEYMVPSSFVLLDAIPRMPNGKVDRRMLPAPGTARQGTQSLSEAPCTPVEEVLAGIWADVLCVETIGINESFFELGGHSLLATQVISRIRQDLRVELPLRRLFEQPTVAGLATCIEAEIKAGQGPPAPPIVPVPRAGHLPLSFAQERTWQIERLLPGTPLFNMPFAIRLSGLLDHAALERSLNEIVRRHELLRTTFIEEDGQPGQVVAPSLRLPLTEVDLSNLPAAVQEAEVDRLVTAEALRRFDLASGPLLRASLLHLDEGEHVALFTMHHIIGDEWSIEVLIREVEALYAAFVEGHPSRLPELPIQYADFAVWQREWLRGENLESQLAYWNRQLGEPLPPQDLPTDRPRPATLSIETALYPLALPSDLSEALKKLSRREASSLFMVLLAAFKIGLFHILEQPDIRVATLIANRNRSEVEGLIGLFANTLILRTNLAGNPSFREVLRRVRDAALDAYVYQDLPFEILVQHLEVERGLDRTSLFQVLFMWQNFSEQPIHLPGLKASALPNDNRLADLGLTLTTYDLIIIIGEGPRGITGSVLFKTVLFEVTTVQRMFDSVQRVLNQAITDPERSLAEFRKSVWDPSTS